MAKDIIHEAVKQALVKDGWTISVNLRCDAARGTHAALLQESGLYAEIYQKQLAISQ